MAVACDFALADTPVARWALARLCESGMVCAFLFGMVRVVG